MIKTVLFFAFALGLSIQTSHCADRPERWENAQPSGNFLLIPKDASITILTSVPKEDLPVSVMPVCKYFYNIIDASGLLDDPNITKLKAPWFKENEEDLKWMARRYPNVTSFNLAYNKLITVSALSYLKNLKVIDLYQHGFTITIPNDYGGQYELVSYVNDENITCLMGLTGLKFGIARCDVTDKGIIKLTNLTDLTVGYGCKKITNMGIRQMTHLKRLAIECYNKGISEEGITHLTNLEVFDISFSNINPITTFAGFVGMTKLKEIQLSNRNCINKDQRNLLLSRIPGLTIDWKT